MPSIGRYWSTMIISTRPPPASNPPDGRSVGSRACRTTRSTTSRRRVHDVVVVGAGPSGSSCAYWLADAGWDVVVVEKKTLPREKTCGDGLTPRAVRQLADMGLEPKVAARRPPLRRAPGGRLRPRDGALLARAPQLPRLRLHDHALRPRRGSSRTTRGARGATVRLRRRGRRSARRGAAAARGPARGRRWCDGARRDDGAHRRGARAVPRRRRRRELAPRPRARRGAPARLADGHGAARLLDLAAPRRRRTSRATSTSATPRATWCPATAGSSRWATAASTSASGSSRRTAPGRASTRRSSWTRSSPRRPPAGSLDERRASARRRAASCPWASRSGPSIGDNVVVTGDAAGAINPFNGEGIAYGYETGRLAAAVGGRRAARPRRRGARGATPRGSTPPTADYFRVARGFVRLISEPKVMQACVGVGMRSDWLMARLLVDHGQPAAA